MSTEGICEFGLLALADSINGGRNGYAKVGEVRIIADAGDGVGEGDGDGIVFVDGGGVGVRIGDTVAVGVGVGTGGNAAVGTVAAFLVLSSDGISSGYNLESLSCSSGCRDSITRETGSPYVARKRFNAIYSRTTDGVIFDLNPWFRNSCFTSFSERSTSSGLMY